MMPLLSARACARSTPYFFMSSSAACSVAAVVPFMSSGVLFLNAFMSNRLNLAGDGRPLTGPFPEPPEITELFADARARLEGTGIAADYVWAPGEPARIIVDVAKERGVSTIVVGHHHHSMLGRLFGTDVAADVSRTADCEVVVVD